MRGQSLWVGTVLSDIEEDPVRFNTKARLNTRRMGDAGGSGARSGGGGGGMPIPGGLAAGGGITGLIVVVVIVVVSMWLGGGSGGGGGAYDDSRMSDTGRYEHCKTGEDANKDVDCARVAVE